MANGKTDDPRPLAVFDLDGTLVRGQMLHHWIRGFMEQGLFSEAATVRVRDVLERWRSRQITYAEMTRVLVATQVDGTLTGIHVNQFHQAGHALIRDGVALHVFSRELLVALKACGYTCVAITGSLMQVVQPFAEHYGFDRVFGTELEFDERDCYVGHHDNIIEPVRDKAAALESARQELGCLTGGEVAIGDTESDFPMLERVTHPIIFNPNRPLLEVARARSIPVVWERKDSIIAFRTPKPSTSFPGMDRYFREVSLRQILPTAVAEILEVRLRMP